MTTEQEVIFKALDDVLTSSHEAQHTLRRMDIKYRRFRRRLEQGSSVAEAFAGLEIPQSRQELTNCLNALEHARHEARREVIVSASQRD